MNLAVYGRQHFRDQSALLKDLFNDLKNRGARCFIFEPYRNHLKTWLDEDLLGEPFRQASEIMGKSEFMLSVGGDGTLLDAVAMVRDSGIPILGINTGRLGFLAGISPQNITNAVESLFRGHFSLDSRTLLRLETNSDIFHGENFALNELTIHKKETASMITIHTYLNGEYLNSYWADGLIISTPTGSTGYSLSCGGPIILPQSENFVITPIAPHNLNVRPIVVSDKSVLSLEVVGRGQNFMASLDSRSFTIDSSVQMAVRKEDFSIKLVRLNNQNFLGTLREKLMWGVDNRN
jgi:NAD+ kinase